MDFHTLSHVAFGIPCASLALPRNSWFESILFRSCVNYSLSSLALPRNSGLENTFCCNSWNCSLVSLAPHKRFKNTLFSHIRHTQWCRSEAFMSIFRGRNLSSLRDRDLSLPAALKSGLSLPTDFEVTGIGSDLRVITVYAPAENMPAFSGKQNVRDRGSKSKL